MCPHTGFMSASISLIVADFTILICSVTSTLCSACKNAEHKTVQLNTSVQSCFFFFLFFFFSSELHRLHRGRRGNNLKRRDFVGKE